MFGVSSGSGTRAAVVAGGGVEVSDERDIYIAYANFQAINKRLIGDEATLPFSRRVIAAAIDSTIERLASGRYSVIHSASGGSVEREIDGLQVLRMGLVDWATIDTQDRPAVERINRAGLEGIESPGAGELMMKYRERGQKEAQEQGWY